MHQRFVQRNIPKYQEHNQVMLLYISRIEAPDSRYRRGLHQHDHITEFSLILTGEKKFFVDEDYLHVRAGDIVAGPTHVIHAEGYSLPALCIGYVGLEYIHNLINRLLASPLIRPTKQEHKAIVSSTVIAYHLLAGADTQQTVFANNLMVSAVLPAIIHNYYVSQRPLHICGPLPREAKHYLDIHYAEPIGIFNVVTALGVSRTYLDQQFQQSFGFTPIDYLTTRRMGEAQTLLINNTDLSVIDIAAAVGYRNVSYFQRLFKQFSGTTPLKYRKIYREWN